MQELTVPFYCFYDFAFTFCFYLSFVTVTYVSSGSHGSYVTYRTYRTYRSYGVPI